MKNGPGDPRWGWQMLMHDLRNPEQPPQPQIITPQQTTQQPTQPTGTPQQVSNIVNYPPMQSANAVPQTMGRFKFATIYAIIVTVLMLTFAGLLLWKMGVFEHILHLLGL